MGKESVEDLWLVFYSVAVASVDNPDMKFLNMPYISNN